MSSSKKIVTVLIVTGLCAASAFGGFYLMKSPGAEVFKYDPGEFFVTNITDSKSLLKSDIIIVMTDKEQFKEFENNTFKVRDILINVLRSKNYEQIREPKAQDVLKAEIKEKLKEKLNTDSISDIYFNEFVVQ